MIIVTPYIAKPVTASALARPDDNFADADRPAGLAAWPRQQALFDHRQSRSRQALQWPRRLHPRLSVAPQRPTATMKRTHSMTQIFRSFPSEVRESLHRPAKASIMRRLSFAGLLALASPLAACTGADRVITSSIHARRLSRAPSDRAGALRASVSTSCRRVHGSAIDKRTRGPRAPIRGKVQGRRLRRHRHRLPQERSRRRRSARGACRPCAKPSSRAARAAMSIVASYPVADARARRAGPALSYAAMVAQVADRVAANGRTISLRARSIEGWDNKPYWNFGCA